MSLRLRPRHVFGYPPRSMAGIPYYQGFSSYFAGANAADRPYRIGERGRAYWRQGLSDARRINRVRMRALRQAGDYGAWPPRR